MDQAVQRVRIFDSFILDLYRGCVQKGSQQVDVTPKAFEVLSYLTANAGRLVPKRELFEAVWPNIAVSDDYPAGVTCWTRLLAFRPCQ